MSDAAAADPMLRNIGDVGSGGAGSDASPILYRIRWGAGCDVVRIGSGLIGTSVGEISVMTHTL